MPVTQLDAQRVLGMRPIQRENDDIALTLREKDRVSSGNTLGGAHASTSTKRSSCRRFRHSYVPSVWMAYSPRIESPVFQ